MAVIIPSYIPPELGQIWLAAYTDAGGVEGGQYALDYALEVMRGLQPPPAGSSMSQAQIAAIYDQHFAGNRRDDGTFRFTEIGWIQERDSFRDAAASFGINPSIWEDRFGELIGGDVDAGEFEQRIRTAYETIIYEAPEIAQFYADNYGAAGLTVEDILVSFLDPTVGEEVLTRNASVSLVGGTASQYGFDIAADFAEELMAGGVEGTNASSQLFGAAAEQLPILEVLAQRHNDPDDDFDIYEFSSAYVFNDPAQRRRMARLVAQEKAMFSGGAIGTARDRSGDLTGLVSR